MELYYLNSENEKIDFTNPPYTPRDISELLDYEWGYEQEGSGISGFGKEIAELSIVINVFADDKKEYDDACERIFSVTEKDTIKNKKGRLYFNGQYVVCNLIGSTKKDWCMGVNFNLNYLRLITDSPVWIKEEKYEFRASEIVSTNNKRYPLKYSYRYANGLRDKTIINKHFTESNFVLRIYGPVVNPQVNINGNPHVVYNVLEKGEYLEINSMEKTILKTRVNGAKENLFHFRGKNVFRKISTGMQDISFGKFDFDLILLQERSEPAWR